MKTATGMPRRIERLPRDRVGRPVPWFVAWIDGKPDFRVIGPGKLQAAVSQGLCWVCGVPFLRQEDRAFVIGPMCAVNRVSAEPPSHADCAVFSAMHCPFLATPQMVRRERHLPEAAKRPAGIMIRRNPGVALVWVTRYKSWHQERDGDGVLFRIGDPVRALWFARGREATRAEVLASIDSGLPILREAAEADGPDAVAALERMHQDALALIPAEVPSWIRDYEFEDAGSPVPAAGVEGPPVPPPAAAPPVAPDDSGGAAPQTRTGGARGDAASPGGTTGREAWKAAIAAHNAAQRRGRVTRKPRGGGG
jgi:hypothetical protein